MFQSVLMRKKDVRTLRTVAAALGIPTRRRPIAQGRRNSELDPRQRARVHRSRHKPPKKQRRVATEFPEFEHSGLFIVEHFGGRSMLKTPPVG
jgi:hypothetical protein